FQKELEMARREYMAVQESAQKFGLEEEKIKLGEADIKSEMWSSGKDYEEFCKMLPNFAIANNGNDGGFNAGIAELENKIIKLRREISEIGGIDEEIMREYEETNNRHEFLTAEFSDLSNAGGALKNLIGDLTGRINNDFRTGLKKINEEFDHYFRLMFGGGAAKLVLENLEDNETGAVISVDVPKKRVHDLNALSGGERALISIALLFAIVSVSRPPFLVLDEVDAALDENNAACFAKVLKDLAKKTQFVLITHNRATMEIANVLYGVTMGDDGVSKLFSLKLEDTMV
ncbi:MAG: AAA family ATPase, partial [bacterium]|nr:AAA family ATPase [bacterium]